MPNQEDVTQLRNLITELGLTWLDEELKNTFSAGKLQSKKLESKRSAQNAFEQTPYNDDEQFALIIKSLRAYFVELPLIRQEAEEKLKSNLDITSVNFYLEDDQLAIPFSNQSNNSGQLDRLLKQIS